MPDGRGELALGKGVVPLLAQLLRCERLLWGPRRRLGARAPIFVVRGLLTLIFIAEGAALGLLLPKARAAAGAGAEKRPVIKGVRTKHLVHVEGEAAPAPAAPAATWEAKAPAAPGAKHVRGHGSLHEVAENFCHVLVIHDVKIVVVLVRLALHELLVRRVYPLEGLSRVLARILVRMPLQGHALPGLFELGLARPILHVEELQCLLARQFPRHRPRSERRPRGTERGLAG
mmetsp:Transcript_26422/g.77642  ORF Transcript_26422/g.77642 Transcript_26422/m.77642 type:complete len:231 (-) Transcript_26422:3-695(-)